MSSHTDRGTHLPRRRRDHSRRDAWHRRYGSFPPDPHSFLWRTNTDSTLGTGFWAPATTAQWGVLEVSDAGTFHEHSARDPRERTLTRTSPGRMRMEDCSKIAQSSPSSNFGEISYEALPSGPSTRTTDLIASVSSSTPPRTRRPEMSLASWTEGMEAQHRPPGRHQAPQGEIRSEDHPHSPFPQYLSLSGHQPSTPCHFSLGTPPIPSDTNAG